MATPPGGSDNLGDPSGRRLARMRAKRLEEAGRVARALELLLERANFPRDGARALTKSITDQEQTELMRADGHVEPRTRFKGGPLRRVASPDRQLLFIDESGKSQPTGSDYFAVGAIAMTGAESQRYKERADRVKEAFWGHRNTLFHEPKMRRHMDEFHFDGDETRQRQFDAAIQALIEQTEFTVFGVGMRKREFAAFMSEGKDLYLPADLYAVAIQMLLERYVDYRHATSAERTLSKVIFEAQGPVEDATHQREYADVLLEGTQWVRDSSFQQWLEPGAAFTPKEPSDPMELADMVSRDIYEWIEDGCATWPGRWDLLSRRIYCRADRSKGKFGVKVFPASDIQDQIDAHRAASGQE